MTVDHDIVTVQLKNAMWKLWNLTGERTSVGSLAISDSKNLILFGHELGEFVSNKHIWCHKMYR
jgi:hypothetical protein